MLKKIKILLVVLLVVISIPSFALNTSNLSKAMNTAAYAGKELNFLDHPGMPKPWTNPQYMVLMNKLSESWKIIESEIKTIETKEDIEKARVVVESFKKSIETYRDLGYQVEISLNDRVKFLEVHGSI